jgi:multidrug resistance efflux pump
MYQSSVASRTLAEANRRKAESDLHRHEELSREKLISESVFVEVQTTCDVARATEQSAANDHPVWRRGSQR